MASYSSNNECYAEERKEKSSQFWELSPLILRFPINFCFNMEPGRARTWRMLSAEARSPAGPGGVNGRWVQHEDPISVPKLEPDNIAARGIGLAIDPIRVSVLAATSHAVIAINQSVGSTHPPAIAFCLQ